MSAEGEDREEWPDRFIYVCNATRNGIVNIAPIVHAGIHRVAQCIIFCGAAKESQSESDREQALGPARLLEAWCKEKQIVVEAIYGAGDEPSHWAASLREIANKANASGMPVIYNASGGRTLMKLGALWFPPAGTSALVVEGRPLKSVLIQTVDGLPVVKSLPRHDNITLEDFLAANNVWELDPAVRKKRHKYAKRTGEMFLSFYNSLVDDQGCEGIRLINRLIKSNCDPDKKPFQSNTFLLGINTSLFLALKDLSMDGLKILEGPETAALLVRDKSTAELLSGKWLEYVIYNKLQRFTEDARIATGIRLADKTSTGKLTNEWGEIDVALMVADQLHVVEVKTGIMEKAGRRNTLAQMIQLRERLLGPFGRAWIVNPVVTFAEMDRDRAFLTRARKASATVYVGPAAVDRFVEDAGRFIAEQKARLAADHV